MLQSLRRDMGTAHRCRTRPSHRTGPTKIEITFWRYDFYTKPFPAILDVSNFDLRIFKTSIPQPRTCMTCDLLHHPVDFQLASPVTQNDDLKFQCPTRPYQSLARWCRPSLCARKMNGLSLMWQNGKLMSTKPPEESVECFPFRYFVTLENFLENCVLLYIYTYYILILYGISYLNWRSCICWDAWKALRQNENERVWQ